MPALKRIGHKGADLIAPGNTLASFDAALAAGVDMIGKPIRAGFNPVAVDVRGHSAWITSVGDNRLARVDFG